MDFQTRQAIAALAQQLTDMSDEVARLTRAAGTPQLTNSSITGGAVRVLDGDGTDRGAIGFQNDGTFATVARNGPPPPAPSTPTVTAGQLSLTVAWDGLFATDDDGDPETMPADFDHVEVHLGDTDGFTPDASTRQGTLRKPGALVCGPLTADVTLFAVLVGVNTSGVAGDASAEVSGVPEAVVASDVLDGIITTVKLADEAVTAAKVAVAAIGTTQIADDAVTTPKIIAGAVQTLQIDTDAVNADKIAAGAVTAEAIAAEAVTSDKIAANAIVAGLISAGALDAMDIHAGTLTLDGSSGDLLVYNGTAALGNLFVSISPTGGVDSLGNGFPAGVGIFNNGQIVGASVVVNPSSGSILGYSQ